MVAAWHALARDVDRIVDNVWAEIVVLTPWHQGEMSGARDTTRPEVTGRGVYRSAQAISQDLGGMTAGFSANQVVADAVLSIREEIIKVCKLQQGDMVTFRDRGEVFEVAWVGPEPSGRPRIHLIRRQDMLPFDGSPPEVTTTVLESSKNPSEVGEQITFTITVTGTLTTPMGAIKILVDGVMVAQNLQLDANGVASWSSDALEAGARVVKAQYADNVGLYEPSEATLTQNVASLVPQMTIWANTNQQPAGTPLTFVVDVTPPSGNLMPTGSVQLFIDDVQVTSLPIIPGSTSDYVNGVKYGPVTTLPVGDHNVRADFTSSNTSQYANGSSAVWVQTVT